MVAAAFFGSLPSELTEEEAKIIELLDALGGVLQGFLPLGVSLQIWAENRVPRESIERVNSSGVVYVANKTHQSKRPRSPSIVHPKRLLESSRRPGSEHQLNKRDRPRSPPPGNRRMESPTAIGAAPPAKRRVESHTAAGAQPRHQETCNKSDFDLDTFLNSLPDTELTAEEQNLRVNIIKYMLRPLHRKAVVKLFQMAQGATIDAALKRLGLPAENLGDWIHSRVGEEILQTSDHSGEVIVQLEGNVKTLHRGTDEAQAISDEFFVDLPEDSFSPEEELLRTAIRDYLDGFVGKDPPTMSMTCQEKGIQHAKSALLPQGVSLKEWMEKRVGEEFDFAPCASGQYCIGYSGELDHDAIANYHPYSQRQATKKMWKGGGRRHGP